MAQLLPNKYPIDTFLHKGIGFGFPLNGNAVFNTTYQTKDQTKANLINYLLTNKRERVFNPNFGSDLKTLLFENITDYTTDELKERIQEDIRRYFPDVIIEKIAFNNSPNFNTIEFRLDYQISRLDVKDSFNIVLK